MLTISAKASLIATTAILAMGSALAPSIASAQPGPSTGYYDGDGRYNSDGRYSYETCRQQSTDHAVAGAVIGGVLGAVVGSHVAATGHRTDGSLVGGGLGAVTGAAIGSSSTNCRDGAPPPPRYVYDDRRDGGYQYDERYPRDGYDRRDDYRDDGDFADRYEDRYAQRDEAQYAPPPRPLPPAERDPYVSPEGEGPDCTVAESPIYMPDGRVQKRFVRVCKDAQGQYQVVE